MSVPTLVRSALLLSLFIGVLLPGHALEAGEVERVVKKDGSSITGEIIGFSEGNYSIRVGDTVTHIPARDVKTIDATPTASRPPSATPGALPTLGVQTILEELRGRPEGAIAREERYALADAHAAVLRGEWDFAVRILGRLQTAAPQWADPQILLGVILVEQSQERPALRMALRLEELFAADALALRTAAAIYRRLGFADRAAETMESYYRGELRGGEELDYELAHLWWHLDGERARAHWEKYLESDPALRRPFCREGELLRKAQLAVAAENWQDALAIADDLSRRYPWVGSESVRIRKEVADARFRRAEMQGDLDVALVAAATLAKLDPAAAADWVARVEALGRFHVEQGTRAESVEEFEQWCAQNEHLIVRAGAAERARVAMRFRQLAAQAVAAGDLDHASLALHQAASYEDSEARASYDLTQTAAFLERCKQELQVGRRERAVRIAALLRDGWPEERERLAAALQDEVQGALVELYTPTESEALLAELRDTLYARPARRVEVANTGRSEPAPGDASAEGSSAAPVAAADERPEHPFEVAYPAIERYFPHALGSRWVYKRGDGVREVRRVSSVTPLADDCVKITFSVCDEAADAAAPGTSIDYYVRGVDLLQTFPKAPPGEVALRYPLTDDSAWSWKSNEISCTRKLDRAVEPLHLPVGSFNDYVVIEAVNSFAPEAPGAGFEVSARLYYVAKIGLVKIESEDASIERVLVEYTAGAAPAPAALHTR